MAEGIISSSDLSSLVLDGLYDIVGDETISDDNVKNYNDVGELSNETDLYNRSIFEQYLDTGDDGVV